MIDKPKKINGFDRYEIGNAARTLMDAEKIKAGDAKFYAVAQAECDKIAEAAVAAAVEKKQAASEIRVSKKLSELKKKGL